MAHNLEYLLTRPGILKITTIVFGIIAFSLSVYSYIDSPYTEFYLDQKRSYGYVGNLPGTEPEIIQLAVTGIFFGISLAYLLLYGFFYELCESKLNRLVDTAIHMLAAFLAFAGGCVQMYSAVEIEDYGCSMYCTISAGPVPKANLDLDHPCHTCHHFGSKILGASFSILNAVVYGVTAVTVFITKDL